MFLHKLVFYTNYLVHKLPVGGKTTPAAVNIKKKCRFCQSETIDPVPKKGLNFPGDLKCIFDDLLQFTGTLVLKTRALYSSFHIAMRLLKELPVTSKRFFALEFIQHHCQILVLRISFGVTWTLTVNTPQPKTRRSMCMCGKLTWTLTPPNPKTWRSICMCGKLTWTLTPNPRRDVACACAA